MLCKMSSPLKLPIWWADTASIKTILEELVMTDVQPLVLAGVTPVHSDMVRALMQSAATLPRRLLICVDHEAPFRETLSHADLDTRDEFDTVALPWETMGGIVLRAYMRDEWDGSWFTREPIPGNEAKSS